MEEVRTIAVIGAGSIGRGIAHAAALGGYRTILEDVLPASLRRAEAELRRDLAHAIAAGEVRKEDANAALIRIEFAATVEHAAREADLVIEAMPEDMESKIEIFTLLDKICRPGTILAANTSLLSVAEIAAVTYRQEKIVGMRFLDPVYTMKSLTLVRTSATDDASVSACTEVGRRMGKEMLIVKEPESAALF